MCSSCWQFFTAYSKLISSPSNAEVDFYLLVTTSGARVFTFLSLSPDVCLESETDISERRLFCFDS